MRVGAGWPNEKLSAVSASAFAGAVRAVKVTDVCWWQWNPIPGLFYNWGWLDRIVDAWRAIGADFVTLVVRSQHLDGVVRATVPPPDFPIGVATGTQSMPPVSMPVFQSALVALLRHMGDRVQCLQIESAAQSRTQFLGGSSDLRKMTEAARSAIKATGSKVLLIGAGFEFGDLYDDGPDAATATARINAIPEPKGAFFRDSQAFLLDQLKWMPGLVDRWEFHSNGNNARGMEAAFGHVLEVAPELGKIPFHVGDATSAPLVARDPDLSWNPWRDPDELNRLLWSLSTGKPGQPIYDADNAMYRQAQADLVAAKIRMARALGAEVVQLNTLGDWKIGGLLIGGAATGFPLQGLVNDDGSARPALEVMRAAQVSAAEAA